MRKSVFYLLASVSLAAFVFQGCEGLVNIDEVTDINTEVTLAPGTEVTVLSEKSFTLKDLVTSGADGKLTVTSEGEYAITYNLEPQSIGDGFSFDASKFALNVSSSFDKTMALTQTTIPAKTPLSYNEADKAAVEAYFTTFASGVDIAFFESLLSQEYTFNFDIDFSIAGFPELIKTFKSADLDGNFTFSLVPAGIPFQKFVFKKGTKIVLPGFLKFKSCSNADFTLENGSQLVANKDVDVPMGTGLSFTLALQSLDMGNGVATNGSLALVGNVAVDGTISINPADFNGETTEVDLADYPLIASQLSGSGSHKVVMVKEDTALGNFSVTCNYAAANVALKNATVQLSKDAIPSFNGNFGFDINGLPEFLSSSDANVELAEVKVVLDVNNALPFDFGLKANLVALSGTTVNHNIAIGPLSFPANQETRHTVDNPELGKILSPVPSRIEARDFDIVYDDSQWITAEAGKNYGGTFAVGFEAPISFTANTHLSLGIDENFDVDLGKTGDIIKGETPVEIKFTAVNSIPLNFGIEVEALDASKKPIPGVTGKFDKVSAGTLKNPATTEVSISFSLPADSKIIKGIGLKMNAYSDDSCAGERLNQNQSVTVKGVTLKLPKGITTDLKDIIK